MCTGNIYNLEKELKQVLRTKSFYLKASQDEQQCENWVPRFFNYLDVNQRHLRLRFILTKNNKNVQEFDLACYIV